MEFAKEQIMACTQEGTVQDYCDSFLFLFNQVRNCEEFTEFYAIYLFICGLKPRIRRIFVKWHQYSCFNVEDVISLALKIDINNLKDSFSPFDPESSFYMEGLEFDFKKSLWELMEGNECFENGKIQEVDIVQETIDGNGSEDNDNDDSNKNGKNNEIPKEFSTEIKDSISNDVKVQEKMVVGIRGNTVEYDGNEIVDELLKGFSIEMNSLVGFKPLYRYQNSHVYGSIRYKCVGTFDHEKHSKWSRNSESSHANVPTVIGVVPYGKQFKWMDTSWDCNVEGNGGEITKVKFVKKVVDENRVWKVGLIVDRGIHLYQKMLSVCCTNWMQQKLIFPSDSYVIWMVPWLYFGHVCNRKCKNGESTECRLHCSTDKGNQQFTLRTKLAPFLARTVMHTENCIVVRVNWFETGQSWRNKRMRRMYRELSGWVCNRECLVGKLDNATNEYSEDEVGA